MLRDGSVGVESTWCGVDGEAGRVDRGTGHANREAPDEERCEKLHRKLKRIVKARAALDAEEAEALREAERVRVWRHYGYSSLLEYMEMEMGYTPRAALERLRVAKAIVELPAIADAMAQGDLSFSAGRELTRVATPETEQKWLDAANDKNLRQVEDMVSGHKPGEVPDDPVDPKLRKRRLRYDDIDEETYALLRQARQILERELGERIDDNTMLRTFARLVVDGARSPERTHAPYQVAATVCVQCKRGWQDGGGIIVEMSPDKLEAALCDAQHIGAVDDAVGSVDHVAGIGEHEAGTAEHLARAGHNAAPQKRARAKSDIPPALRRRVRARDHGTCRVPWCRSSRNVDQHHIRPLSQGGTHTLENIISLCESHHLAHHAGALIIDGTASNATFTRRAHNSFAIAERIVETKAVLRTLGFDKREVSTAIEKARTHVGTAELTLEQWIKIALSYCPKPRAS